jgi:hypothetical protein
MSLYPIKKLNMKTSSLKNPVYFPGFGWEIDLDETTCDAETLAYLERPYNERNMPPEEWQALYRSRIAKLTTGEPLKNSRYALLGVSGQD